MPPANTATNPRLTLVTGETLASSDVEAGARAFDGDGAWLKAALHTHTSASDGELTPEAVAAHYGWAGFDVLAITDHWTLTSIPSTEHLLVITGAELAVDPLAKGRYTEILAIGIDELPEDPGGDRAYWERIDNYDFQTFPDLTTAAAFITEQGGVAFVAHPYWSGLPPEVIQGVAGLTGLELYNASAERECGRGDSSYIWDLALEAGMALSAIATDDSHYPLFDIGDAWTMVHAEDRSRDAVLSALRAGRTYASNGPTLHDVRREGDEIEVRCSPCTSVALHSRFQEGWAVRADHRGRQEGGRILERDDRGGVVAARFQPEVDGLPFVRVVVTDAKGRNAWTNPV
jgi:predicted metal-dependent phosphoesterase TrpH